VNSSRHLVPTAALAAAALAASAQASIIQIDRVSPTNEYGTGGYGQRTGNSGSNSLLESFNLTRQANWVSQQALSDVTMPLTFDQSTTATLDILNRSGRAGDQFRYAEVAGSAPTGPTSNDWNQISATGQFTNTFAAGTYTFVVEFFNSGGSGGGVPLPGAAGLAARPGRFFAGRNFEPVFALQARPAERPVSAAPRRPSVSRRRAPYAPTSRPRSRLLTSPSSLKSAAAAPFTVPHSASSTARSEPSITRSRTRSMSSPLGSHGGWGRTDEDDRTGRKLGSCP
jgi:hypothetical protein